MKTITLNLDTKKKDLKPGDLVMTCQLMRVVKIVDSDSYPLRCVDVRPQCGVCKKKTCAHECCKYAGYGQQGVLKVLRRSK